MRKTGARLSLSGAMARQTRLEPLDSGEAKSSSLTKAEREIKLLKQENQKLRTSLSDTRTLYNQLVQENSHEKFDERRVTLLKSQVIQLERQLMLFSEALSSRSETLFEVENNLQWLADRCRLFISKDVHGPHISIARSELTLMVETAESARIKLYKQIENKTTEKLSRPLNFTSDFLQTNGDSDVTLLEIATGSMQHLNLKHVTKLEGKLSCLYKDLIHLHAAMDTETSNDSGYMWTSCHVITAVRERLMTQILKSCAMMKDCSCDLLDLTMLYPSAPWPPLRRCALKEITAERVIACLPARSRSEDLNQLIQALVKAYNYKIYMLQSQTKCLREEVTYHQRVYNLQLKYTESLFQAIREAYSSFEETSNELIVKPLNELLEAYADLSQSASEKSLKSFIQTFKDQVPQLSDIVQTIEVKDSQESDGSKVLSQYGEEFFQTLEKLVRNEQSRRDLEAGRIDEIRNEQTRLDGQLRDLLEEQEHGLQQTSTTSSQYTQHKDVTVSETVAGSRPTDHQDLKSTSHSDNKEKPLANESVDESKQSAKKVKHKPNEKPKPRKEWVSILDDVVVVECGMSDCSVEPTENNLNDLSDADLYNYHTHADMQQEIHTLASHNNKSRESFAENPPKITKKKLGYVPNTFVPNRTLQLRMSGSLTRLASQDDNQSAGSTPVSHEEAGPDITMKQTQGKNIPKSRPAFR